MSAEENKSSGIFRRTLVVVFMLLAISAVGALWAVNSTWLAQKAVSMAVARINSSEKSQLEVTGFTGTVGSGIKIDQVKLKQAKPPFFVSADKIALSIDFLSIGKGTPIFTGSIDSISAQGMANSPVSSSSIPAYRGLQCFLGGIGNIRPASFSIGTIRFNPWSDTELVFVGENIQLQSPDENGSQKVFLALSGEFRSRKILAGQFDGSLHKGFSKLTGNLDVNFAGQKIVSEINLSPDRGHYKVGGFIASASLNITELSQWLIPIWQDAFPFGFDGSISGSGSWHYSRELGFFGNLAGEAANLRMVALGLFISVFEINCSWKYFDGSLSLADSGSLFMGFPAEIGGKIEAAFEPSRKWGIDFSCSTIDFAKLTEGLPWGVKYTMALPPLEGLATFSLKLRGSRPEVASSLFTDRLVAGAISEQRDIAGSVNYDLGSGGPGKFRIAMKSVVLRNPPPLWQRYRGRGGSLAVVAALKPGPYVFEYSFDGLDSSNLQLQGVFYRNGEKVGSARGNWHEGMGSSLAMLNESSEVAESFVANDLPLLDFILMK